MFYFTLLPMPFTASISLIGLGTNNESTFAIWDHRAVSPFSLDVGKNLFAGRYFGDIVELMNGIGTWR